MPRLNVILPTSSYSIHIEPDGLQRVGEIVQAVAPHQRAALMVDMAIADSHGADAMASLMNAGINAVVLPLEANEQEKNLDTVHRLYRGMIKAGLERKSPVIALGGGVIGDIAGFIAATYLRGVPLIHVPTTLLAMVDASIGGKTGVNFPLPDGSLGKNLIGAFYQPRVVIADPHVLRTLSPRDFRCGLAECIKHAMIADADLLTFVESNAERILSLDMEILPTLIEHCARIKAEIVQQDEREDGRRALLNLGHTFAHVMEPKLELDLRHGEAVAIGLMAAMKCAIATNRMTQTDAARVQRLLERVGLPLRLNSPTPMNPLIAAMGHDKKVTGGKLRLILPRGLGAAEIVDDLPFSVIESAWREVGAA